MISEDWHSETKSCIKVPSHASDEALAAVDKLNLQNAVLYRSTRVEAICRKVGKSESILWMPGKQKYYQAFNSFQDTVNAEDWKRWQGICIIKEERALLVWTETTGHEDLEALYDHVLSVDMSLQGVLEPGHFTFGTHNPLEAEAFAVELASNHVLNDERSNKDRQDPPQIFGYAIQMGLASLSITALLLGVVLKPIVALCLESHHWSYFAWSVAGPCAAFLFSPLFQNLFEAFAHLFFVLFEPWSNSKFFSNDAGSSRVAFEAGASLPTFTVVIPVYKESLDSVIAPTLATLFCAISEYELLGGKVDVIIGDDGLQLIDDEEKIARVKLYDNYGTSWVARPKHTLGGYQRRGKLKWASNVNNTLNILRKIENHDTMSHSRTGKREKKDFYACVIQNDECESWYHSMQAPVFGDFLLLITSDFRVHPQLFARAATDMMLNPKTAVLRYRTAPMRVLNDVGAFKNWACTNFLRRDRKACLDAAAGCPPTLHGGNDIYRLSVLDSIAYYDEDNFPKIFSESHLMPKIVLGMQLQCHQHLYRFHQLANADPMYWEGVPLTVYYEIKQQELHAYAIAEIFKCSSFSLKWLSHGPFSMPLCAYLGATSVPVVQKAQIFSNLAHYCLIALSSWASLIGWIYLTFIDEWKTYPFSDIWKLLLECLGILFVCVSRICFATCVGAYDEVLENLS